MNKINIKNFFLTIQKKLQFIENGCELNSQNRWFSQLHRNLFILPYVD